MEVAAEAVEAYEKSLRAAHADGASLSTWFCANESGTSAHGNAPHAFFDNMCPGRTALKSLSEFDLLAVSELALPLVGIIGSKAVEATDGELCLPQTWRAAAAGGWLSRSLPQPP